MAIVKDSPELLKAEIARLIRLLPREQLAEGITNLVTRDYIPRLQKARKRSKREPTSLMMLKICRYYGVSFEQVIDRNREGEVVHIRKVAMYILSKKTQMSTTAIGKFLSDPYSKPYHHSTVIHHREDLEDKMLKNPALHQEIEDIIALQIGKKLIKTLA